MDVIDLRDNSFKTLPAASLMGEDYPALHYLVSLDSGDYVQPVFSLNVVFLLILSFVFNRRIEVFRPMVVLGILAAVGGTILLA